MSVIDDLLAESGVEEEGGTITFTTEMTGRVWTAKPIVKSKDWEKVFRRAKHFEKMNPDKMPATYKGLLPISSDTARGMAFMEAALVEPKLTILDMLTLASKRGMYFIEISTELQAKLMGAKFEAEDDLVDFLEKTSGETVDEETCSESPLASGDSIPTNSPDAAT